MAILDPIKDFLLAILNFFFELTGDFGVAIILLTLAVRIFILPLTVRQTQSMREMRRVQPKLKELQEKYKGDKKKLQEEMMKFYSENNINPLGGCLPLILQLPVFFALFRVLLEIKTSEPFLFLVPDLTLSARDPKVAALGIGALVTYYVLIGLMMLTTYVQQKQMSTDPRQERIMLPMTLFMAFIAWSLPAGVLLYWVTTNAWAIGQQAVTDRLSPSKEGS